VTVRAEFASLTDYLADTLEPAERERIGLISFNHWSFAVGAVIETSLAARALGSEVTIGFWADETPLPDVGWRASRAVAHGLRSLTRDEQAERALLAAGFSGGTFASPPIRRWSDRELPAVPNPATRNRIRELTYKGSDMGRSVLQVHPDDDTPIREDYVWPHRWVKAAMRSYAWAFDQAQALIRERRLGTVVVYNGRFTHDQAVAAAAAQEGIRVLYYDTGGYETDFDLTEATTHDWAHLQGRMRRMYDSWDPTERDVIGSSWFLDRQSHRDENNRLFVGSQTRGHVDELPEAQTLVVFFSSSGDEIAELDIDWAEYLHSQEAALSSLAETCRGRPGTRLVVRTHPHMRLKPADDLADWMTAVAAAAPDVHFDPYSTVDSYALMERANVVFTYGSTAGVESGFFGRPVVVMGPSAYDQLGCARRITSVDEIADCLEHPPVPNSAAAIPYGLMMQRRGFSYAHVTKMGVDDLQLGDVAIHEATENTRKASDALRRARTWWLTKA
jgi:hypothetical protein